MNILELVISATVGLGASLVLIRYLLSLARNSRLPDRSADLHHVASSPIPRIGGLALVVGLVVSALVAKVIFPGASHLLNESWVVLGGSVAMFALGFWDDLRPLGARKKLALQLLVATGACAAGLGITSFKIPLTDQIVEFSPLVSLCVSVFWLVALTNLINLIDGVDGLAGGISLMLMVLLAYVGQNASGVQTLCAGMGGALLGFLRYNFPPARIYMGDGGAYMLGFLVAAATITSSQKGTVAAALVAPLFVLALPILDTSLAILRRGLRGLPVFRPDRRHIHHHLLGMGWSHRRTVLTIYCFCLLFLLLGFAAFWSRGQWLPVLMGLGVLVILLAAGRLNFSREWFAVGRVVGNSLQMRGEIQYALVQTRWLDMEGRRCRSIEDLWSDLVFIARKLGFKSVRLRLEDGERVWDESQDCQQVQRYEATLNNGLMGVIEVKACRRPEENGKADQADQISPHITDPRTFETLSDILAEGWLRAARRWMKYHGQGVPALRFSMARAGVQAAKPVRVSSGNGVVTQAAD